ncbi:MAG: sugar transferase [Phycisphaerae bacterium]
MSSQFAVDRPLPMAGAVGATPANAVDNSTRDRSAHSPLGLWGQMMFSLPPSAWMLADVIILVLGIFKGYGIFGAPEIPDYPHVYLWQACLIFTLSLILAGLVFGLYQRDTLLSRSRIVTRMLLTAALAVVLTYAVVYVMMYATLSRKVTAFGLGSYLALGIGFRVATCWAVHRVQRGLLIIGPGLLIDSIAQAAKEQFLPHYRLAGFVDDTPHAAPRIAGMARLGGVADVPSICRNHDIHDIVVGQEAAHHPQVMNWLLPCLRMGCRVTNEATFYEKTTGQILVDQITPHWFLFADLRAHCDEAALAKRAVDVVASAIGLILTLPLWPVIALAIKLGDGGPVFYSQDRTGQNGEVFRLYKLRTMKVNAETHGPVWATRNDPRVTTVGRFLRRTRLDELPQLYNVFRGQMSLVGPRPERPDIVQELCPKIPYYSERHLVKPGITGWAQIGFRYGNTVADAKRKLQFDLYYLKHMSFELDAVILFRTLGVFLRGAC